MTIWILVAILVVVYPIAGVAIAALIILADDGSPDGPEGWIPVVVLLWPLVLMVGLSAFVAKSRKARREASREKPRVYSEFDEP